MGKSVEGLEVVDSVGEFDEDNTDIFGDGDEHFTQVLDVALHAAIFEFTELGDAFDHAGDVVAEVETDVIEGDFGVFGDVVEEAGDDDGDGEFEIGESLGGGEGVDDVGFAGVAKLASVGVGGEVEGKAKEVEVGAGGVGLDFGEQMLGGWIACRFVGGIHSEIITVASLANDVNMWLDKKKSPQQGRGAGAGD